MQMNIRHSIVLICFNQEAFIEKALDSILNQKIKPYEIIVGDDFSTDQTRFILKRYKQNYPKIIKLFFNDKNIGIFANLNNLTSKVTGDIVSFLAGDDWFKPQLLENMNNKLFSLKLDPKTEKFIFLPKIIYQFRDGTEMVKINNFDIFNKFSPVGLALRNQLLTRYVGISRSLYDEWPLFEVDADKLGLWTDYVQFIMFSQHIDKIIEISCEGPVYRIGVGVSSKSKKIDLDRSFYAALQRIDLYKKNRVLKLNANDELYLEFMTSIWGLRLEFSALKLKKTIINIYYLCRYNKTELFYVIATIFRILKGIFINFLEEKKKGINDA